MSRLASTLDQCPCCGAELPRYCKACRAWHPRRDFGRDPSRRDGLHRICKRARARIYAAAHGRAKALSSVKA